MLKNCQNLKNLNATSLMLKMSLLTDSSINATLIAVKYDRIDGSGNQLVKKSIKKLSKFEKPQMFKKSAKVIGLEESLLKHQSFVNQIQRARASIKALTIFQAFFTGFKSFLSSLDQLLLKQN